MQGQGADMDRASFILNLQLLVWLGCWVPEQVMPNARVSAQPFHERIRARGMMAITGAL